MARTKADKEAAKQAARERMARARAAKAAKAKTRDLVVLYRNGTAGEDFVRVTPLRFTQGNAALQFANILAELFPAYEFVVAIEKNGH